MPIYEAPYCSNCGLQGHYIRTCPSVKCHMCGLPGHMHEECPLLQCSNCGKTGHMKSKCPRIVCRRCQQIGHMETTCRNVPKLRLGPIRKVTRDKGLGKGKGTTETNEAEGDCVGKRDMVQGVENTEIQSAAVESEQPKSERKEEGSKPEVSVNEDQVNMEVPTEVESKAAETDITEKA